MLVALRSRRQIAPFTFCRPATVADALALRAEPGTNVLMAGGIELIDWMKYGHAVDRVIRLDGIPELSAITAGADGLRIGAMATHAAIATSPVIREVLPDLASLWPAVANPRVRFTGTIGGNVMCGKADYDGLPALMALGAEKDMPSDTLLTGFTIPNPSTKRLYADRSLRPALTLWLGLDIIGGRVTALRVALGMAHPTAVCVTRPLDLPLASIGQHAAAVAADVAALLPEPVTDGRASAAYRRRMTGVLTRRILIRAGDIAERTGA
jgi:carbon-monoxide dehydrogenase medium subunit